VYIGSQPGSSHGLVGTFAPRPHIKIGPQHVSPKTGMWLVLTVIPTAKLPITVIIECDIDFLASALMNYPSHPELLGDTLQHKAHQILNTQCQRTLAAVRYVFTGTDTDLLFENNSDRRVPYTGMRVKLK
jgi:hypothetical protein